MAFIASDEAIARAVDLLKVHLSSPDFDKNLGVLANRRQERARILREMGAHSLSAGEALSALLTPPGADPALRWLANPGQILETILAGPSRICDLASTGARMGHVSPIWNALEPDAFVIVTNAAFRGARHLRWATGSERVESYPGLNRRLLDLARKLASHTPEWAASDCSANDGLFLFLDRIGQQGSAARGSGFTLGSTRYDEWPPLW